MRDVLCLCAAPMGLTMAIVNKIKDSYQLVEQASLKVDQLPSEGKNSKQQLVLVNSLDGIIEQSKLCNLQLYIYKAGEEHKRKPVDNFYLEPEAHYANPSLRGSLTGTQLRKDGE